MGIVGGGIYYLPAQTRSQRTNNGHRSTSGAQSVAVVEHSSVRAVGRSGILERSVCAGAFGLKTKSPVGGACSECLELAAGGSEGTEIIRTIILVVSGKVHANNVPGGG